MPVTVLVWLLLLFALRDDTLESLTVLTPLLCVRKRRLSNPWSLRTEHPPA
jgi:hypothetical protein